MSGHWTSEYTSPSTLDLMGSFCNIPMSAIESVSIVGHSVVEGVRTTDYEVTGKESSGLPGPIVFSVDNGGILVQMRQEDGAGRPTKVVFSGFGGINEIEIPRLE